MTSQIKENATPQLSCETCGKALANKGNLKKHIEKFHKPLLSTDTTTTPTPANDQDVHVEQTEAESNEQTEAESNEQNDLNTDNQMMAEMVEEMELLESMKELTQGPNESEEEVEVKKELLEKINRFKVIVTAKNKILQRTNEDKKSLRNEVECSKQVETNTLQALKQKEKEIDDLKRELKAEKDMSSSVISESKTKKKAVKDLQKEIQQLKSHVEERNKYIKKLEDKCNATEETNDEEEEVTEIEQVQMSKNTTGPYCVTCKRGFVGERDLDRHMNDKHQSKECPLCDESFANKLELVSHINMCMERNAAGSFVKCNGCKKNFNRESLRKHNKNGGCGQEPQNPTLVCNKCNAVCISVTDLRKHIRSDHDEEKSRQVCRHWRAGNCLRGERCDFSHVGFQTTSDSTTNTTTGASKTCRNGSSCGWLARGKCHFSHQDTRQTNNGQFGNQGRQAEAQNRSERICWYNENCNRNPCPFKHLSMTDFPNLPRSQNPRIQVWNNGKQ